MGYMGFDALKAKLASQPGIRNPAAVAATEGRRKYGKSNFQKHAAEGKTMRRAAVLHSMKG